MLSVLCPFLSTMFSVCRSQAALQVEIVALRHPIGVLRRSAKKRPKLTVADRVFWAWLSGALGRLAIRAGYRQTRDGHRLASQRLPVVLDLEGSARKNWKARRLARSPGPDPYHEPCQPNLGCAANPRRITQARYRYWRERASANIWSGSESRPAKPGGHFSTTTSNSLSR